MIRFEPAELTLFLTSVDRHLGSPKSLILIGGAAAALAYGVTRATVDIDTVSDASDVEDACDKARRATGLNIPLDRVGVFDGPYGYEERLETVALGLTKLSIRVPEKHDLALMKTVRGEEHDRAAIAEMARAVGISQAILVARFKAEMGHIVLATADQLRWNLLAVIERLFGESEAQAVDAELTRHD